MSTTATEPLMTVQDLGKLLQVNRRTIYSWIQSGKVPCPDHREVRQDGRDQASRGCRGRRLRMNEIELWHGDCLELMGQVEDQSIDMILSDPPYGTTALRWDSVIPFEPLWAHYKRVIKPRGAVVLTGSQPFTSMLVMSNPEWFKYEWIWEKSRAGGVLDVKFRPMKSHENVMVFSGAGCSNGSSPAMTYNPQKEQGKPYVSQHKRPFGTNVSRSNVKRVDTISDGSRYPKSVLRFPHDKGGLHPTQKPVDLFAYLIRTYTNEGETVLDNCLGSGTTAVAAIRTGRKCIGIEKEREYFDIAQKRVAEELAKTSLFD